MIVPSMTGKELIQEIYSDFEIVSRKAKYLFKQVRRKAITSNRKFLLFNTDYTSPRKNNWVIFVDYNSKNPTYLAVVHFLGRYGFNAYLTESAKRILAKESYVFFFPLS